MKEGDSTVNAEDGPLKEEDKTYTKHLLGGRLQQQDEHKILGVQWNYVLDELLFDLNELAILISAIQPTKIHIVGVIAKFYDPLRFVSPVIVRFKILFQELCSSKVD